MRTAARGALLASLAFVAVVAWLGYRRPDFLLWLANATLICS